MEKASKKPRLSGIFFSLCSTVALYFLLSYSFSIWKVKSPQSIEKPWVVILIFGLPAALLLVRGVLKKSLPELIHLQSFAAGLILIFISDWTTRNFSFMESQTIRGELLLLSIAFFFFFKVESRKYLNLFSTILIFSICYAFYYASHGRLLFSDDHSVFFYRLDLLKEHFPNIPVYNVLWTAGRDSLDLFATGVLNFFFINAPLIYLFELHDIYNTCVVIALFILPALSSYYSGKLLKLPSPTPAVAALLSITTSSLWYVWGLAYGTLGFIVSAALTPLVFALSSKIFSKDEELKLYEAILLIISFSLVLCWAPAGLSFLPAIALGVIKFKQIYKKKYLALICLTICLINIPWIYFLGTEWKLFSFLNSEKPSYSEIHAQDSVSKKKPIQYKHKSGGINIQKSLKSLRETANRTNPLFFFLAVPGFFLLRRSKRTLYGLTALWLFIAGTLLVPLKPQLELDRLLVILLLFSSIPVALSINQLIEDSAKSTSKKLLSALSLAFLATCALNSTYIASNRSIDRFSFDSADFDQMVDYINQNHSGARILFSGHVVHELDGGHLAPLSSITKKPLLASSHAHEFWTYTQIFPGEFIAEGEAGVERYLDLHNADIVAAHEPHWRRWFLNRPEKYEFDKRIGKFLFFKRKNFVSNYFYEGSGKIISQSSSGLTLTTKEPEAIIKFRYVPPLTSTDCNIEKVEIAENVDFIKLSNCPKNKVIKIRAKTFSERLIEKI